MGKYIIADSNINFSEKGKDYRIWTRIIKNNYILLNALINLCDNSHIILWNIYLCSAPTIKNPENIGSIWWIYAKLLLNIGNCNLRKPGCIDEVRL